MAVGLVTITSSGFGQDWSNTWGIQVGSSEIGGLTNADMTALLGSADLDNDGTTPGADVSPYEGSTSPLAAIIGFHRLIQYAPVIIKSIQVSDGQRNPGSSVFFSRELGFPCVRVSGDPEPNQVIVPLSIAWLINRNGAGFSQKPGRLYLRGALGDVHVKPGSRVGVEWASATVAASMAAALQSAITGSLIGNWFGESDDANQRSIGIPKYGTTALTEREVTGVAEIASLSSGGPKSRQLTRGRRRTTSSPGGD